MAGGSLAVEAATNALTFKVHIRRTTYRHGR
ncbi:uncharacterized protein DNG_05778 [Cephalotrichum gorgonifer]|uniref:Uncharacterized protein n=1 Tax=Cephalotrichum gorgonifer TaxID=2041049 RepID=A0AAE8MYF3_9PEZI|nr:uncharacterized protein DNG_05778 [Cephalotrichum gorgonifer]